MQNGASEARGGGAELAQAGGWDAAHALHRDLLSCSPAHGRSPTEKFDRKERAKDLKRVKALNRRLDLELLDKLNMRAAELRPDVQLHEDGINELEFVIGMSVELGVVDMDQIKPFIDQFRKIDVDGNGYLGMEDLRLKVNNMVGASGAQLRRPIKRLQTDQVAPSLYRSRTGFR